MSRILQSLAFGARFLALAFISQGCAPLDGEGVDLDSVSLGLEDPTAKFTAAASSNFKYASRGAADIEYIVVHTMEGYYGGSISWFQNPSSKVSAHYLVRSSDGEITQMVDISDVAYHDACFNAQSVGIEHEGFIKDADIWYTDKMYESSAKLSAWLAEAYGIPLDRSHILGHGETDDCSDHTDPGPDWDWDKYMTLIREAAEPTLAAKLVQYEVPSSLAPGEMANVWFELENQSSDVLDDVRTRLATAEPSGRESPLFVTGAWLSKNTVAAPDAAITKPGERVRFSFPIVAPAVAEGTMVRETFQLVHEGRSFGPLLTVELEVRSGAPAAQPPEAPRDDAGISVPPGSPTPELPVDDGDAGVAAGDRPGANSSPVSGGTCSVGSVPQGSGLKLGWLSLCALLILRMLRTRGLPILLSTLALVSCVKGAGGSQKSDTSCARDCDDLEDASSQIDANSPTNDGAVPLSDAGADAALVGDDADTDADLVDVGHRREMRGVWIASVGNINFPSAQGLSVAAQKAEIDAFVASASKHGINALFFQVRPEADALYESSLEPWSRYLTGTQGKAPGYDPLSYVIERAHAHAIELHAWLNPYRASSSAGRANAKTHVANTLPQHVRKYGSLLWMDPGVKAVQDHTRAVVRDVVTRYAVDGIHFDDYFYPYPDGTAFPDASTYTAYKNAGGKLSLGDFRRDSVNSVVRGVSEDIRAIKPQVVFGISPFGIYRPGMPQGIEGLDQYAEIYADPLKWVAEDWVDYLAPQLYWPTTQPKQAYEKLLDFWSEQSEGHCLLFAGNNPTNLGKAGWDLSEMKKQVALGRVSTRVTHGNVFFTIAPITNNVLKFGDALASDFYARPALSEPPLRLKDSPLPKHLSVTLAGRTAQWTNQPDTRAYVAYRLRETEWMLERILPADIQELSLEPGTWALSRVATSGRESRGLRVVVPAT